MRTFAAAVGIATLGHRAHSACTLGHTPMPAKPRWGGYNQRKRLESASRLALSPISTLLTLADVY